MTAISPIVLILGAGPNVGSGVVRAFAKKGYKTVTTSRSPEAKVEGGSDLHIQADLADPSSLPGIFEKLRKAHGPPSAVVYNGQYSLILEGTFG